MGIDCILYLFPCEKSKKCQNQKSILSYILIKKKKKKKKKTKQKKSKFRN